MLWQVCGAETILSLSQHTTVEYQYVVPQLLTKVSPFYQSELQRNIIGLHVLHSREGRVSGIYHRD
jgi:hypothetical protein